MFAVPAVALTAAGAVVYLLKPEPIRFRSAPSSPDPDTLSQYPSGRQFWTVDEDVEMPVYLAKKGLAAEAPMTVIELFDRSVANFPDEPALTVEEKNAGGDYHWVSTTWSEYQDSVKKAARSFLHLGLARFGSVCMIGFNRPEWLISYMAAVFCGAKGVGIYPTNSPDSARYIACHCKAKVVIAEDWNQIKKFISARDQLKDCSAFVVYQDISEEHLAESNKHRPTYTWAQFMQLGEGNAALDAELQSRMSEIRPGHICSLIYTSGTTGLPKATMVTHDSIIFMARQIADVIPDAFLHDEHLVSYLPLSHIAAQVIDGFAPMLLNAYGSKPATLWFARPDALKGSLPGTLLAARPTLFFGVPRIWEKFAEKFHATESKAAGIQKQLVQWARSIGVKRFINGGVDGNHFTPWFENIAERAVFSKVRAKLGLDRCRLFSTGAAPIHYETLEYLAGFGIRVLELYGMSECTGACTTNYLDSYLPGSVGRALEGVEIKLEHVPGRDKLDEGEICLRGRGIMAGYMSDAEKTQEVIDCEGFLHSGDLGRQDENGFYHIVGRKKELIITAGGENIAPVPIESAIKTQCPGLANIVMIGDKRKYNVALVTLKCRLNPDGSPSQELDGEALTVNLSVKTVRDAINDSVWEKYITDGINAVNANAASNASKVQKFRILPIDFSVQGGELTPSLKVCRPVVTSKYKDIIDEMYKL